MILSLWLFIAKGMGLLNNKSFVNAVVCTPFGTRRKHGFLQSINIQVLC
jgi:hypothetical protein